MQTGYTGVKNMNESIGWIGGGRVARILLSGWKEAGMTLENIVVSDPDGMALDRIIQDYPGVSVIKDGDAVAAGQDLVFLAIPPAAAETVLPAIKPVLKPGTIVISTIPGLSVDQTSRMLGGFDRIVRIIPNAPSMIGSGYTPVFFPPSFLRQDSEPVEYLTETALALCHLPARERTGQITYSLHFPLRHGLTVRTLDGRGTLPPPEIPPWAHPDCMDS